jgi:hypothetical protein
VRLLDNLETTNHYFIVLEKVAVRDESARGT